MKTFDIAPWHTSRIIKYNDETIVAVQTEVLRNPKAGEWYIETHLDHKPLACFAYKDLTQQFWIAEIGWVNEEGEFSDYYDLFPEDKKQPFVVDIIDDLKDAYRHPFVQYLLMKYRQDPRYNDRDSIRDWLRTLGCDLRTHNIQDQSKVMEWLLHMRSHTYEEKGALLHSRRIRDLMFMLPSKSPEDMVAFYSDYNTVEFVHALYGKDVYFGMTRDMQKLLSEHDFINPVSPNHMFVSLQDKKLYMKYRTIHGGRVICYLEDTDILEDVFSQEEARALGYDV